ncbi:PQQ-binding-like beta-propeller repeat protein, partial [Streptomyces sp. SID486]
AKEPADRPTPDELMRELRSVSASYETQAFIPAQRIGEETPAQEAPGRAGWAGEAGRAEGAGRAKGAGRAEGADRAEEGERAEEAGRPGGAERAEGAGRGRPWPLRVPRRGRVLLGAAAAGLALAGALVPAVLGGLPGMSGMAGVFGRNAPEKEGAPDRTAASGSWTARPAVGGSGMPQCAHDAGKLFCARPGVVFALSASDGRLLWRRPVGTRSTSGPPVVSGGLVQPYTDGGPRLAGLDPATGENVWQRRLPTGTTVRYAGGTALLAGPDGTVTGVDGATGATRWRRALPGQGMPAFATFPGAAEGTAYATRTSADGTDTRVSAVDPRTGRVRWDVRVRGWLKPFAAQADGSVLFLAVDSGYGAEEIVRYTPGTGATRRVALPAVLDGAHATVRGNVVYVLAAGGSLDAVDLASGRRLWHLETSVSRGSLPVASGERVYFTASDGRLLAVDARRGRLVGQTPARLGAESAQVMSTPPAPLTVGADVYAGAPDGTVFAVDSRSPATW